MRRDFVATYDLVQHPDHTQRQAIDYLLGSAKAPHDLGHLAEVTDPVARVELLAQALVTVSKSYAQSGDRRTGKGGLKQAIGHLNRCFQARRRDFLIPLGLLPSCPPLQILPDLSIALHFTFALRKPYLSQDEAEFYVIDNPVRKDKVFGLPYIAPSQWKGALRAAMVRQLVEWWQGLKKEHKSRRANRKRFVARRVQLTRLFGTEKDVRVDDRSFKTYLDDLGGNRMARWYRRTVRRFLSPTGSCAGRLRFYPTFFTRIGLEIINPHSRETGAGEVPILIESVPAGARGDFALFYVPQGRDGAQTCREVAADLERVTDGVQAMLLVYGFGAKTSSGYGVTGERFVGQGALEMNFEAPGAATAQPAPPEGPQIPDEVRDFLTQYPDEDFSLKVQAWRKKHRVGKPLAAKYRRVREAFRRYQQELAQYQADQTAQPAEAETPSARKTGYTFGTWDELETVVMNLVTALRQEVTQ